MKPRNKRESWLQWNFRDHKRICVNSAKVVKYCKKKMSKVRRRANKKITHDEQEANP